MAGASGPIDMAPWAKLGSINIQYKPQD